MIKRIVCAITAICILLFSADIFADVNVSEDGNIITVTTSRATYKFDKAGGGFKHIYDKDNNDWIGTGHGSNYQGIPNLVHPADYFHPYRDNCDAEVTSSSSDKAVIRTWTTSDSWELTWEFYDTWAKMTVVEKGGQDYWFLYEGEPGGKTLNSNTFWMNSDHGKESMSTYSGDLPSPEWAGFGNEDVDRTLFLLHYEDDSHPDHNRGDGCCGGMSVFGFGRNSGTGKYLTQAPQHFAIGFIETKDYNTVKDAVEAIANGDVATRNPVSDHAAMSYSRPKLNYKQPVRVYTAAGKQIFSGILSTQKKLSFCSAQNGIYIIEQGGISRTVNLNGIQ